MEHLKIRLAGVEPQSIVDGPGLRYTIFTQGCPHACPGCHNENTWDFEGGSDWTIKGLLEDIKRNPLLAGITLSGGEPLCRAAEILPLAKEVKAMNKSIVAFTGYTLEELFSLQEENKELKELLGLIDILIDGRFVLDQKDLRLQFRGSHNQRVLDLPASLEKKEPVIIEEYM